MSKVVIEIELPEKVTQEEVAAGGDPLRALCRKEVARFDEYLKNYGGDYSDGLAKFERLAVEGYLYQKIRGHIDASPDTHHNHSEG